MTHTDSIVSGGLSNRPEQETRLATAANGAHGSVRVSLVSLISPRLFVVRPGCFLCLSHGRSFERPARAVLRETGGVGCGVAVCASR